MKNTFGIPIIPDNDKDRVAALQRYHILDSPPEASFNQIAELARQYFGTPIALISLVDADRVYFKANMGMPGVKSVERGTSLCSLAVLADACTVFEDALEEPCLLANPLVAGTFGLRFYAGAPLVTPDGFNIGSICLVDREPRSFSSEQRQTLERFAALVMNEIELRLAASRKAEELGHLIAERTLALEAANKELKRSNEELEQFAYVASHDMQEPLRKIMNFSRLLATHYQSQMPVEATAHLKVIDTAANRMHQMVRDVLDYARVSGMASDFKAVDLNDLMVDTCMDLETAINESAAEVVCDLLPTVMGNEVQLKQVFSNLISNAIKFARKGTVPQIRISAAIVAGKDQPAFLSLPIGKNYCNIRMRDNGIGFRPEHAERIFQLFHRLHSKTEYPGTGIGLALCKKIVRAHGGDIVAFGQPDKGAEFQIWVPLA